MNLGTPKIPGIVAAFQSWISAITDRINSLMGSGSTANRPTKFLWVGRPYFNTDTGAEEWWDGAAWVSGGGGSGAPTGAQYVTMALSGSLSAERVLTAGTNITITDGGANGPVTIDAASGAPTNASYLTLALNGSLSAERVLTAGTNITFVDTGANGTLTINASGGGSTASGTATLDFGGSPSSETDVASVTVADAGVGASSEIVATVQYAATADHTADESLITPIHLVVGNVSAGVGFDILGYCFEQAWGKYSIAWVRS